MGFFDKNKKETGAYQGTAGSQTQAGNPVAVSLNARGIKNAQVSISQTDYGAVNGALTVADNASGRALVVANNVADNSLYTARSITSAVIDAAKSIVGDSQKTAKTISSDSLNTAKSISTTAIRYADDSNRRSFDFAEGFGSEVMSFSKSVIDKSNQGAAAAIGSVKSSSEGAIKQIAKFAESQSLNNDERITKIALWGVGIVAAVAVGPQLIAAFKG